MTRVGGFNPADPTHAKLAEWLLRIAVQHDDTDIALRTLERRTAPEKVRDLFKRTRDKELAEEERAKRAKRER